MEGCLAISEEGTSGGLALLWRERNKVTIQSYSKYHVDSLVNLEDGTDIRFTGFYGQAEPTLRNEAWDMLRRIKSNVRGGWIVGGEFNAILNDAEKEGGRRKPRNSMNDFNKFLEELSLVDIKTRAGWFTWSNNRDGSGLVKERLDRFIVSEDVIEKMPFIDIKVIHQSKSDHDAIFMNTIGSKPRERCADSKPWFRYDVW
ncbi:reverse transcriptase [Gossypium australe]|uniref:Reverse transcriptase n=1 Tax=Gossypium australe TaxID=47621 RepID=A0A5B6VM37_9ROSI|nr:reverse transcriptase [Gossypium australe]